MIWCRHNWEATSVNKGVHTYYDLIEQRTFPMWSVTVVLYVCTKCEKMKTKELVGQWTLDDVRSSGK